MLLREAEAEKNVKLPWRDAVTWVSEEVVHTDSIIIGAHGCMQGCKSSLRLGGKTVVTVTEPR